MDLDHALDGFRKTLEKGDMHVYLTNTCYDKCKHCYMSAVTETSKRSVYINSSDLFNFVDLMRQGKQRGLNIGLSGGDHLLHPNIVEILDRFSEHSRLEILTSGFALSDRNRTNREDLLKALARSNAFYLVASPDEPYHSLTWDNVTEIRDYIKNQGFNPNKFGYSSRKREIVQKTFLALNPIGLTLMGVGKLLSMGESKMPQALPFGRGKSLIEDQQMLAPVKCNPVPTNIYLGYNGDIQYCMYAVQDGFMNITELQGVGNKNEAIELILDRFANDITSRDMMRLEKCYFSGKIRKKHS